MKRRMLLFVTSAGIGPMRKTKIRPPTPILSISAIASETVSGEPHRIECYTWSRAAIISPEGLERLNRMDAQREKEFDALLARTRAAFADVPEEQLMEDVVAIIERDRKEQRKEADAPKSA
jgi:hypothetical protein